MRVSCWRRRRVQIPDRFRYHLPMQEPRLQISEGMRRILDYPRFRETTRMLVLETGYFFDQSWLRAGRALGWETAAVSSAMIGGLTRDQIAVLFRTIAEFKPDFLMTSNYAGMDVAGIFSRFFEDARLPYVSWFTDTPRMILFGRQMHLSHYAVAATWERAYIPYFEKLGFQHIVFLPHATDPELFQGKPETHFDRDLAFVGMSMVEQTQEALEKHLHLPHVVSAVEEAFAEGRVTRETYARGMDAILDPELLSQLDESEKRNVELLINYESTRRQREDLGRTLAPLGLEVRGDPGWLGIVNNVGGQVGYFSDLAPFYRRTRVNVNSTSLQMRWAVNQRVFDCPAAGGFLITDNQADMERFFEPETESITYSCNEELRDKAAYFLKHPEERRPIIMNAQRRIAAEHTHAHRLQTLETCLRERFA